MSFFIVLFIVITFIFFRAFKVVSSHECLIIERLGKFSRTASSCITFIFPFLDKVKARIDLREQLLDISPLGAITKDNVVLRIEPIIFYQILEPKRSIYEVENLTSALMHLTQFTLRDTIGKMKLSEATNSANMLNNSIRQTLDEASEKWGCRINRVEIKDISLPKDIQDDLMKKSISSMNFSTTDSKSSQTYQYSTFFKEDIQPGDVVRVLNVDGTHITIEKIKNNF